MKTVIIEGENGDLAIVSHNGKDLAVMDQAERIEYWQNQGAKAVFNAAWEMIRTYCRKNGVDPRMDRAVEFYSKNLSDMQ
jgi:hypothetical protein